MLRFIFGKPSSGKTYMILEKIKNLSDNGYECILIVPEQFTFESERAVLKKLGDKAALNVGVFSFTRLCDEIGHHVGGIAGITLSDCDKVIFMKRALSSVSHELSLWAGYCHSVTFAKTMLDTIGEFKINAVTPEDIRSAAEKCSSQKLKMKLLDIALIYETYDALTGEKYIDPADSLTKLYNKLEDFKFFKDKTVFIDSFKGFTGQQFKIIERIFSQAEDVYVSLTNNPENRGEYNIYANIRAAVEKIEKIALSYGKTIMEHIILNDCRYENDSLKNVEALISGDKLIENNICDSVTICKAATMFDEAEYTARSIRKLVREKGHRFRDFVIIARDADSYKEAVISACNKNNIPLFFDNRIPLSAFPLARAAEAVISALDFSTENILRFHKTGLGTLNTEEISVIENYAYLWNISGKDWLFDFVADPRGFVTEEADETVVEQLEYINILRKKAVKPIAEFKENYGGNALNMAKAIIKLFDECDCSQKLINLCENLKLSDDKFNEDVLRQSYEEYIRILDSLVRCFGEASISKDEFTEALNLAVSLSNIGVIPQMLDEVSFGSADRIRPSRPKIAFILGANQGVFPMNTQNNGLLNLSERKDLIEFGINIADNSVYSSIDEEYLVYCNLCCSSEKLYVTYALQTISGESLEPSAFVLSMSDFLKCNLVNEPQVSLNNENLPETVKSAYTEFCKRITNDKSGAVSLRKAVDKSEECSFEAIENFIAKKEIRLTPDTATKLFGENITMSASKFDKFNRCHFSFFCLYGLGAKRLQPADFDVMQRGTIVHFVLEKFITEHKDDISSLDNDTLDLLTEDYINIYLDTVSGYRSIETPRMKFLLSRISRSLKEVVRHVAAELMQSDFKPMACELKIGIGSNMGELNFPYDKGNISVIGSIDRVDSYNGYIRIIDYKTGSKSFKLPDILFGLNMQMLIYLYAITRGNGLEDSSAAGILYQPSSRDINDNGMAMNGLLQSDTKLVTAMDKECQGEFVPKLSFNKDGSIAKRCTSFIDSHKFTEIFDYIEKLMKKTGNSLCKGDISISPIDGRESPACKYCDYARICGIENATVPKVPELNNTEVFEMMKEAETNGI